MTGYNGPCNTLISHRNDLRQLSMDYEGVLENL